MADKIRRPLIYVSLALVFLSSCYYFFVYPNYGAPWHPHTYRRMGNEDTTLRPRIHFSPEKHWMNDPNGLFVDANSVWHMYYQYTPYGISPGRVSWGHATSTNLYEWTVQPLALHSSPSTGSMYTGSIVLDPNNTSSFFPSDDSTNPGIVAIYTQHFDDNEVQAIAVSHDGGLTFTQDLSQNPVIDIKTTDFRDPKVIWYAPTSRWIMVVANAGAGFISIYSSENLISWHKESEFRPNVTGTSYECPNLVRIPVVTGPSNSKVGATRNDGPIKDAYLLLISNGGGSPLNGGSVTRFFPGTFNGTHFAPFDDRTDRFLDFGPDNYAAQFFYDGRNGIASNTDLTSSTFVDTVEAPILISWASNLRYCWDAPTGEREGWRGVMTLPRAVTLAEADWRLVSHPVGLSSIPSRTLDSWEGRGDGSVIIELEKDQGAISLEGNITFVDRDGAWTGEEVEGDSPKVQIEFRNKNDEKVIFGWSLPAQRWRHAHFFVDRADAVGGWDPPFEYRQGVRLNKIGHRMSASLNAVDVGKEKGYTFLIVMDRSVAEVFLNDGVEVGTMGFWPWDELNELEVSITGTGGAVRMAIKVAVLG